jgi:hypothetical protein
MVWFTDISIRGSLVLNAGEKYIFEMAGVSDSFQRNPFALTLLPSIAAKQMIISNITGNNPGDADDATLVYTPPSSGASTIYYASTVNDNMGGIITIANSCNPSHLVGYLILLHIICH